MWIFLMIKWLNGETNNQSMCTCLCICMYIWIWREREALYAHVSPHSITLIQHVIHISHLTLPSEFETKSNRFHPCSEARGMCYGVRWDERELRCRSGRRRAWGCTWELVTSCLAHRAQSLTHTNSGVVVDVTVRSLSRCLFNFFSPFLF